MAGWGEKLAALAAAAALAAPAGAQSAPPPGAEIDPDAPLDPMPDLGVAWPTVDSAVPTDETAAQSSAPVALAEAPADLAADRPYALLVTGLEAPEQAGLLGAFRSASALEGDRDKAANAAQLDRRARGDAELLAELLRAGGYYDAAVRPAVRTAGSRVLITLTAVPGAQYRFADVELPGIEQAGADAPALRAAFAVKAGDPVDAAAVTAAGVALRVALGRRGFARAEVGEQQVVVDHGARTARLVLPVTTGPFQRIGTIRVSGRPDFGTDHVRTIARFQPGERFRQDRIDDLRRALIATGLVSSVEVRVTPAAADPQLVDLDVRLEPAPARTIAGELGYGTGEGVRAEVSWQHRNLIQHEGALTLRAVLGTQEQLAGAVLRFSNWRARDRVLTVLGNVSHVDRDAYEARTVQLGATVERQSTFLWRKTWTWSAGAELITSDERDVIAATGLPRRRTFFIGALPATLNYDRSNDLLDPTSGFRLGARLSPELSLQDSVFGYARAQLDASGYRPFGERVVVAGRVRLGTILGANRDRIAPSRRFYAGGGGSVRGYGYQRLGPRDANGDPIGGRSLAEFSLETRVRFGAFGVVPFVDGGTLSTDPVPDMKDWQFGAGLGLRYYSTFGPIRLDVGTPLNRRRGDSRVAVTVSLGQAF